MCIGNISANLDALIDSFKMYCTYLGYYGAIMISIGHIHETFECPKC